MSEQMTYLGIITIHESPSRSIACYVEDDVAELKRNNIHPGSRLAEVAREIMESMIANGRPILSLRIDRSDYFH